MRRYLPFCLILAATLLAGGVGWWAGRSTGMDRLAARGENTLRLARDRLEGQIDRYRALPRLVAEMPVIARSLGDMPGAIPEANELMERLAGFTGALDIYLMRPDGLTIAASNWRREPTFIGNNYTFRPYFRDALAGGLGRYHARGSITALRGYFFASPVRAPDNTVIGVVAVKVDVEVLEAGWQDEQDLIWFTDRNSVVFIASKPGLVFRTTALLPDRELTEMILSRQYDRAPLRNLPEFGRGSIEGRETWTVGAPWAEFGLRPGTVLHLSQPVNPLGFDAHILLDTGEVLSGARLTGVSSGAVVLVLGLGWLLLAQRRAALAARLQFEEDTRAELSRLVGERTRELTRTNHRLIGEVAERRAAEEALRRAQDDLVQAGKLSALGQMSAGISHELNQPLAAIRSFAENGTILLDRGREAEARENLTQIADLTARMARIIRNLRAFVRREGEELRDVALDQVVADSLGLLEGRFAEEGVTVDWAPGGIVVRGGGVRLAQVLVNLLSNAADAMRGQPAPHIGISATRAGDGRVSLSVRDSGPGLSEDAAGRLFDPFYTTKQVGEGHGLGLGLSISYGIVQSFGGVIRGATHPDGGAVFTVTLTEGAREEAA
ncbi:sensor histidine kinase [Paroceanicella profunda]|uniref:C4-dicarboxylate transport sensor protein DctB n=1 Tax=Paroceanicella profunda TaxID=2579971 RepID=A0A5B8G063_9RHOB|nr:ATP-binding protein [Paroceanicella profunda]QDL93414.1 sensor histidine kinase [Paroceanicella profunda]